jgi:hypothetical protein
VQDVAEISDVIRESGIVQTLIPSYFHSTETEKGVFQESLTLKMIPTAERADEAGLGRKIDIAL